MTVCLINQPACGRVAGSPVCPKCGMDERVVYPGEADREAAQAAALARYEAAQSAVKPLPPPELPKPPIPPEPPARPPKQPEPESPVSLGQDNKGINRLGVGVLVLALMGGGWWWKDQRDLRAQQAEAQAAQQALAAEQARSEREAEKKRAAEAQPAGAVKAQAPVSAPTAQATTLLHGRYQILADGSEVKDVQTGLVWARCSVGQHWVGQTCTGNVKTFTVDEIRKLAGNGWRVPKARELHSILWCSSGSTKLVESLGDGLGSIHHRCSGNFNYPSIRSDVFVVSQAGLPNFYWSRLFASGAGECLFDFRNGSMNCALGAYYENHKAAVRLVRVDG